MNPMSSRLRVICGIVLIVLSTTTYQKTVEHAVPGSKLLLFGMATDASPAQVTLGLVVVGLIGATLVVVGARGIMKSQP
jgi:uncharacterized membrane protein YiaA